MAFSALTSAKRILAIAALALPFASAEAQDSGLMRDILLVGNNWDGTADVIDVASYSRLMRVNVVPDKEERLSEIKKDPIR